MAERTGIAWTDHTFNPWIGCQKVSPGCDNCYAEKLTLRRRWTQWGPEGKRKRTSENYWREPIRWDRRAKAAGTQERVFCASLADVLDNQAPPGAREDLWQLIRSTPNLDWQLLTKRPQNLEEMLPPDWGEGYPNVWLGVSAEDQNQYDRRWPILARTPAIIKFISYEPTLGGVSLAGQDSMPDWLIWGGESGSRRRRLEPEWIRRITQECCQHGVAVFGKQWGAYEDNPLVTEAGIPIAEVKKMDPEKNGKGGAMLDGQLWREFPVAKPREATARR